MAFKVYKSSAGSGKTYTLVKEYLNIALANENPNRFKSILAITFTNKAANEMKERVIKYLKAFENIELAEKGEQLLFESLQTELGLEKQELQNRGNTALKNILHSYSDFNITTIDKFVLKIVRAFALDLELPANFEVELDADSMLASAIENLISNAGTNKQLTAFFLNYVKQLADNDENWNIESGLLGVAKESLSDVDIDKISTLKSWKLDDFSQLKKEAQKQIKNYEESIREQYKNAQRLIQDKDLAAEHFVGKSQGSVYSYFFSKTWNDNILKKKAPEKLVSKFELDEWAHKDCPPNFASEIEQIKHGVYAAFEAIESKKEKDLTLYISLKEINRNLFSLALLNEIEKMVEELKKEKNFVHISEFNKRVAEIVIDQPIPFIYERIGEKYKNYLIDEFQDTSILQWQNILPLIDNSLANGNDNLIVGDAKQAIYRWRGGDAQQFVDLPGSSYFEQHPLVAERLSSLKRNYEERNLTHNYRSLPNIIEFNNLFFETLLKELPFNFESFYKEVAQEIGKNTKGGYAEISLYDEEVDENNLLKVRNIIEDNLARGRKLSDIVIVARRNASLKMIAEHLTEINIPIISSESLAINESPEVKFVLDLFRFRKNQDNLRALIGVLGFLESKEGLHTILESITQAENVLLKFNEHIKKKHEVDLTLLSGISLYDQIEGIIEAFQIDKSSAFIQGFLDIVLKNNHTQNSNEFLNWWDEKKNKFFISSPEEINAVSLMTIHKSKGLEFPVVIFPFANALESSKGKIWVDSTKEFEAVFPTLIDLSKSLEDSHFDQEYLAEQQKRILDTLNMYYVALTRASEELYILIQNKRDKSLTKTTSFFFPILEHLNRNENQYTYGTKQEVEKGIEQEVQSETQAVFNQDWRKKIKLSFTAPQVWNIPLTSEDSFDLIDPRKYGNLLHSIIGQVSTKESTKEVVNRFYEEGKITNSELNKITSQVNGILNLQPLSEIWDEGEHLVERDIISINQDTYRPDRIITFEGRTWLIDFKTGKKENKHQKQILQYKKLLSDLNYNNITSILVYTELLEIEEVLE